MKAVLKNVRALQVERSKSQTVVALLELQCVENVLQSFFWLQNVLLRGIK